jgi:hypothetical protein
MGEKTVLSTLKLETGRPVTISLKYPTPRQVKGNWGPQLLWMLGDGQKLYTPLVVGKQIASLGIKPGQRFTIQKVAVGNRTEWHTQLAAQPIAAVLDSSEDIHGPELSEVTEVPRKPATQLESALKTAVAAAAAAEKHGEELGYAIRFTSQDVRAMGISVLIGLTQGNKYAA